MVFGSLRLPLWGYQHLALMLGWAAHVVTETKMMNIFTVSHIYTLLQ